MYVKSVFFLSRLQLKLVFDTSPFFFSNLEQLTIRTMVRGPTWHHNDMSCLPSVVKVVNLFLSSLRHLAIDFNIYHLSLDDFSPLAALGAAFRSIPHVDLYFYHEPLDSPVPRAQILSLLESNEDIARSITMGVLVIHWEQVAPDLV